MRVPRLHEVPPDRVWGGIIGLWLAYEAYALSNGREGYTWSERTRHHGRTDHPLGAAVFTVGWAGFAAWFWAHIVLRKWSVRTENRNDPSADS